ncbi:MAG: DUF2207 domain-containing protein [Bacteroidales bacterium]|nr:DUF2207 domain-containing protein [Candidatus Equibacterium intestinale]
MFRKVSLILAALACSVASFARLSHVGSIAVDVSLQRDGSARITEVWTIDVNDENTEWYKPLSNLGVMSLSDYQVSEGGRMYYVEPGWNIDRSRSQKAGRCGIVDKGREGYELCWGVGSSGLHTYTVSYTLSNFVKGYNDADGFHYQFVNRGLQSPPDNITVVISAPGSISHDNADVWAFNYYGDVQFEDGKIVARTSEPLPSSGAVTIMAAFNPGMFSPDVTYDDSFDSLKSQAFNKSDYVDPEDDVKGLLRGMLSMVLLFVGIVAMVPLRRWIERRKYIGKDVEWYREIPYGRNLRVSSGVYNRLSWNFDTTKARQNLVGAYFLRLFNIGALSMHQSSENGKFKTQIFVEDISGRNIPFVEEEIEKGLYDILKGAAGEDHILQKRELSRYITRHQESVSDWFDKLSCTFPRQYMKNGEPPRLFGLQKFLKDFSIIDERHVVEVALWDEYLVFATMFGMADQVFKDFKKICPEYFQLSRCYQDLSNITDVDMTSLWYSMNNMSRSLYTYSHNANAAQHAIGTGAGTFRAGGGGGFASFGGGGGFSGGGFGGGGR